jgi:hypothetical protein
LLHKELEWELLVPHYGQFACCRIKIEKTLAMIEQKADLKGT